MDFAAFEAKGWERLEAIRLREDRHTVLQVIVGMGSVSGQFRSIMTGYGFLISVGQMSDSDWQGMVEAARLAAEECVELRMCFVGSTAPSPG